MSCQHVPAISALLAILALSVAGCGNDPAATPTPAETPAPGEHAHAHPDHGPHGGDLVELGSEEYHAEVVHEADGRLSVYILDGTAANGVAIDAAEVVLNLVHDGAPRQIVLAAAPLDSDPAGKSSRFVSADGQAGEDLDQEGVQARLAVTIDGASYQGEIAHDHAHADHDHADGKHQH